ncbi:hypothetical protein SAMN02745130_02561 [Thiothrix eikelboomii]|uniref:CAAX prenyl protease 2/Lysostaphin resistance protein A-like domain-containing protein n=1 Tax=Thiothrix eikelboomii TaxID=92487 RepID=A0A1T4X5T0_9GAMM|nr:CPBP family intramembrane glutamic endopeptidase [Thiothrix eikelboomii]SKA84974.1 hypothetical protein SAMN02745130_02561 [Thiothrix eikelboomii]
MRVNPLDEVRSTWVVGLFVVVFYFIIGSGYAFLQQVQANQNLFSQGELFILESLLFNLLYLLLAVLLWWVTFKQRDELTELLLNPPAPAELPEYLWLAVGMIISSIGLTYLMYYPLSLVAPELVQRWLLDVPPLLYWDEQGSYWLGNLLVVISAVIFAPIVEEFIFRGYLLNRWSLKLGALPAVILSSGLFAFLHNDILGAFVFGVVLCLLYMKTRSLVGPILVHIVNNLIAVSLEWMDLKWWSGFTPMTLQDFYDQAGWGIFGLLVGVPWLWRYAYQHFKPLPQLLKAHEQGGQTPNSVSMG